MSHDLNQISTNQKKFKVKKDANIYEHEWKRLIFVVRRLENSITFATLFPDMYTVYYLQIYTYHIPQGRGLCYIRGIPRLSSCGPNDIE